MGQVDTFLPYYAISLKISVPPLTFRCCSSSLPLTPMPPPHIPHPTAETTASDLWCLCARHPLAPRSVPQTLSGHAVIQCTVEGNPEDGTWALHHRPEYANWPKRPGALHSVCFRFGDSVQLLNTRQEHSLCFISRPVVGGSFPS